MAWVKMRDGEVGSWREDRRFGLPVCRIKALVLCWRITGAYVSQSRPIPNTNTSPAIMT
jgi:hypothetical protein